MVTKEEIIEVLKKVNDPEIMIDVYTLGLIYDIKINNDKIDILMTFTTIYCPYGPMLAEEVKNSIEKINGVKQANIEITFDPPWQPSDDLKVTLGI